MAIQVISTPRLMWDDVALRFIGFQRPDGAITLFNALPEGGTAGQILTRTGEGEADWDWRDAPPGTGSVADGNKVDVTVTSDGATWTINGGVVTTAKLGGDVADVAKTLLTQPTVADQRTALLLGTSATLNVDTDATLAANAGDRVPSQSAVKAYVDANTAGLQWKTTAVRVATTAAGTLASSFENGDTVDGVVLATGDRILVKNQASAIENGIYTVNASGAPTRATDADTGAELFRAAVLITAGTANAGTQWTCTNTTTPTVGADNITFGQIAAAGATYTADGTTLQLAGNQFAVKDTGISTAKLGGDITTAGKALLDDANAAAQRTTLGLGTAATSATGDFAAAAHGHAASDITSGVFDTARLGTGTANSSKLLRGDGTWQDIPAVSATGVPVGLKFTFSTTTTDGDPGAGTFRFNSATQSNADRMFIDTADADAVDVTAALKLLGEGTRIRVQSETTAAQYHELLVTGNVLGSGYFKIEFEPIVNGTAIDNAASCRIIAIAAARGYEGTLHGDITAVTRNGDGSLATVTIAGCAWTQNYASNGALSSETFGGLTRTYNYSANGVFTGVSGAVERGGYIVITSAQGAALTTALASAGAAAAGFEAVVSDLGKGGIALQWATDHWRPAGGLELILDENRTDIASTANGTVNESGALRTFTVPGWINSVHSWIRSEAGASYVGTAGTKTIRAKHNGDSFDSDTSSSASAVSSSVSSGRYMNKNATNVQQGANLSASAAGYSASATAAGTSGAEDTTADASVTFTLQCANAADTATLNWAAVMWGSA